MRVGAALERANDQSADFFSAEARLRSFAMVAAEGSFRLLFLGRRLRFVT